MGYGGNFRTIKKDIVTQDELDYGIRQLLNYGHTIGHAIEQYSNYELLHGEAISIGMCLMAKESNFILDLKSILSKYNLPTTYEYVSHPRQIQRNRCRESHGV